MPLVAALQNAAMFIAPVVVYAIVVRWRSRLTWSGLAERLGLLAGTLRVWLIALATCVPTALVGMVASAWTKGFQGSMLAPYVGAPPSLAVLGAVVSYGVVATGFPEELLFRGLIAGVLFRRLSFCKANIIQALVFVAPHLLLLLVAPQLWPLFITLPFAIGLLAGWTRYSSGSIIPGVLVHAVSNMAGALAVLSWAQ